MSTNIMVLGQQGIDRLVKSLIKNGDVKIVESSELCVSIDRYKDFMFMQLNYRNRVRHGRWRVIDNKLTALNATPREYEDIIAHLRDYVGLDAVSISNALNIDYQRTVNYLES